MAPSTPRRITQRINPVALRVCTPYFILDKSHYSLTEWYTHDSRFFFPPFFLFFFSGCVVSGRVIEALFVRTTLSSRGGYALAMKTGSESRVLSQREYPLEITTLWWRDNFKNDINTVGFQSRVCLHAFIGKLNDEFRLVNS